MTEFSYLLVKAADLRNLRRLPPLLWGYVMGEVKNIQSPGSYGHKTYHQVLRRIAMDTKGRFFYFGTCLLLCVLLGACELLFGDITNTGSDDDDNGKTTVTVSLASVTLAKGTTQQFSAQMSDSSSTNFTWSIEGDHAPETTISREGLLSVAANETARTFSVKAKEYWSDEVGTAVSSWFKVDTWRSKDERSDTI
jgi:hypothetical protein